MAKKQEPQKDKRAETDVVLQQFEVTLAGKKHVVQEKSIKETTEFRRRVGEILADFADPFFDDMESGKLAEDTEGDNAGKVNRRAIIKRLLPAILAEGADGLVELLWAYAPELQQYEPEATDAEILNAALEVLKITLPLIAAVGKSLLVILKQAGIELV